MCPAVQRSHLMSIHPGEMLGTTSKSADAIYSPPSMQTIPMCDRSVLNRRPPRGLARSSVRCGCTAVLYERIGRWSDPAGDATLNSTPAGCDDDDPPWRQREQHHSSTNYKTRPPALCKSALLVGGTRAVLQSSPAEIARLKVLCLIPATETCGFPTISTQRWWSNNNLQNK